jgi:hypothetical protein
MGTWDVVAALVTLAYDKEQVRCHQLFSFWECIENSFRACSKVVQTAREELRRNHIRATARTSTECYEFGFQIAQLDYSGSS